MSRKVNSHADKKMPRSMLFILELNLDNVRYRSLNFSSCGKDFKRDVDMAKLSLSRYTAT